MASADQDFGLLFDRLKGVLEQHGMAHRKAGEKVEAATPG